MRHARKPASDLNAIDYAMVDFFAASLLNSYPEIDLGEEGVIAIVLMRDCELAAFSPLLDEIIERARMIRARTSLPEGISQ